MTEEVESAPDAQRSRPDLSIIIVNWNVCELLRACLQSIVQGRGMLDLEVIVVDSASSDDSVVMVQQEFPWVRLIPCVENVGFPRGNNVGMAAANGRFLYLLNPDTEIVDTALEVMVRYLVQHPDVGAVGSQLLHPDGTVQSSRRRFPTLWVGLFESTWLQPLAPASLLRHYYALDLPDDRPVEVDWVMGASLMVRRDVLTQVGGMDEAYFMYSEELDWCRRIKDSGRRVVYLPTAQVVHYEGKSSEQAVTARHINFNRAKLRYFRKYHGRLSALLLRVVLLGNYGWQVVVELVKGGLGHKRQLRWQRVKAYWAVLRSGLRPAGY